MATLRKRIFGSDEDTEKILKKIDKGETSGFIREAIKEKAHRNGLVKCKKKK